MNQSDNRSGGVFVENENGVIKDRPVSLGIQTASDAEVVAGLTEEE